MGPLAIVLLGPTYVVPLSGVEQKTRNSEKQPNIAIEHSTTQIMFKQEMYFTLCKLRLLSWKAIMDEVEQYVFLCFPSCLKVSFSAEQTVQKIRALMSEPPQLATLPSLNFCSGMAHLQQQCKLVRRMHGWSLGPKWVTKQSDTSFLSAGWGPKLVKSFFPIGGNPFDPKAGET